MNPFGTLVGLDSILGEGQAQCVTISGIKQFDTTRLGDSSASGRTSDVGFNDIIFSVTYVLFHFHVAKPSIIDLSKQLDRFIEDFIATDFDAQATDTRFRWPLPDFLGDEGRQWLRITVKVAVAGIETRIIAFNPFLNDETIGIATIMIVRCNQLVRVLGFERFENRFVFPLSGGAIARFENAWVIQFACYFFQLLIVIDEVSLGDGKTMFVGIRIELNFVHQHLDHVRIWKQDMVVRFELFSMS